MTTSSILQKLDILEYQEELTDVTSLAEGLVQLQHRRYPHLVPMYRTVHRTVPRKMTFRAIRWVNPKRMFPGAGLSEQEMRDMTPEEREKLIVDLNTYREEAFVIHNRYNQMIWMIERGQKPYFIPYANIPEDRWMTMQDYMDRAERLKDGTKTWEHALDVQADTLRRVLREEDSKKLDDIEGLWIGPDGEARAPLFMDIKQKRGQVPMRRERTIKGPDGNVRLKVVPKAFPRLFLAVHPDEVREGEKNRLPPEGQWLDAGRVHDSQRDLAAQVGDAGFHLLRLPKAPFRLGTAVRDHLRQNGQFISAPAGRGEHPVQLFFDNVPENAVKNRRWQRVSQPERGGRHATGAPFSGPEGRHQRPESLSSNRVSQAERDAEEDRRAASAARRLRAVPQNRAERLAQERIEQQRQNRLRQRQQEPDPQAQEERERDIAENLQPGERPPRPGENVAEARARRAEREQQKVAENAVRQQRQAARREEQRREAQRVYDAMAQRDGMPRSDQLAASEEIAKARADLLTEVGAEEYRFSKPSKDPLRKRNPGEDIFESAKFTGQGGIRGEKNFTVMMDGKKWIYKVQSGDSRGEAFAFALDRAMGLNVMPAVHMKYFGMKALQKGFENAGIDLAGKDKSAIEQGEQGGGHLMEFCDDCSMPGSAEGDATLKKMMGTEEGRASFMGLTMLDFMTGNHDRHGANWLVHKDGSIVAIDNALDNISRDHKTMGTFRAGSRGGIGGVRHGQDWSDVGARAGLTRDQVKGEVGVFFDKAFANPALIEKAAKGVNATFGDQMTGLAADPQKLTAMRDKFVEHCLDNMNTILGNLGI